MHLLISSPCYWSVTAPLVTVAKQIEVWSSYSLWGCRKFSSISLEGLPLWRMMQSFSPMGKNQPSYPLRWLYTRSTVSCSFRGSWMWTRQVKRSWCSARPSSFRACSGETRRKLCRGRVQTHSKLFPCARFYFPLCSPQALLTLSFIISVPCISFGFFSSGKRPKPREEKDNRVNDTMFNTSKTTALDSMDFQVSAEACRLWHLCSSMP